MARVTMEESWQPPVTWIAYLTGGPHDDDVVDVVGTLGQCPQWVTITEAEKTDVLEGTDITLRVKEPVHARYVLDPTTVNRTELTAVFKHVT